MKSISFFMPAYNCAETVAESVESIMSTNFCQGDELIIVNGLITFVGLWFTSSEKHVKAIA